MKKIILYITILLLALPFLASSQIATIQTLDGTYGNMQVNVNLTGFTSGNSVGAITMKIGYDPNVASFTGITHNLIANGINANAVGNEIIIAWSNTPAVAVNGIAFKLNFVYTGGSCNLTFNEGCEIAGALGGVIQTTYLNGAIHQPSLSTTAVIGSQQGNYSIVNEVPVTFSNFPTSPPSSKVGAISFNISYDVNKLQFVGVSGLTGAVANAAGGVISLAWSNTIPIDLNTLNLKLKFNYLGGTSNVNFTGTNIISNANGIQIPVSLVNGQITQPPTSALVDIGDAVGQVSGNTIVPVAFSGFPINQGSLTMNIAYNNSALNFVGVSGLTGLNANASNGEIHLAWSNSGGVNISGFNLLFTYIGGTSNLAFTGLNQITNNTAVIIPVSFTNGSVTQPPTPVIVSLGNTALTPGNSTVLVPINLSSITGSINAATMYVNFDNTKLTYNYATGAPATPAGLVVNQDPATKTIIVTWANGTTSLADGKLLDLNFTFNGGIGNCDVPVYFTTYNSNASSLSDDLAQTVLATWVNGNVNLSPAPPTGAALQYFCSGASPTVADLVAAGTGLKWYIAPTGGTALATSTPLVNGTHYYASQTVGGCESISRLDVNAIVYTTPGAPTGPATQPFCSGASPTVGNLVATGTGSIRWYTLPTGGTALALSTALVSGQYYASQTSDGCESVTRLDVNAIVYTTPGAPTGSASQSNFLSPTPTVADLVAIGFGIQWYDASSGGTALVGTTLLVNGAHYFASQTVDGCESSDRFEVTVTLSFVISGVLKYDSDPNTRIPLVGFTVKLKSGLITVDSTLTDINGYYEFMEPNGTYTLESSAPPTANYYSDGDDAWAIVYYSFGYDYPYIKPLRILAGDVNQDGVTDDVDAWAVIYRAFGLSYPGYEFTAPDFLFENPTVIVNFADMLNQDILGICSGNVLGSNPNPNP